ncbi:hypothetical protein DLAC_11373 [Tieghemostelium lacteum]|uniref:RNase III domain-containing protein n=1 Tax=Tieghemostelium lacteum TaxID=361077 RepID=A0A151Z3U3_TIELA|nr:hypothetical protein DLAC_11373 [Tieghemostelium lacteum]|eukprot:KYQ88629.1 hypothetical protein DLAC_11373 [Tieghemostelium lacteum]
MIRNLIHQSKYLINRNSNRIHFSLNSFSSKTSNILKNENSDSSINNISNSLDEIEQRVHQNLNKISTLNSNNIKVHEFGCRYKQNDESNNYIDTLSQLFKQYSLPMNLITNIEQHQLQQTKNNNNNNYIIESFRYFPDRVPYVHDKLMYFGEMILNSVVTDSHEYKSSDKELFIEFKQWVKSPYFLRKKCEQMGFNRLIGYQLTDNQLPYVDVYNRHYNYLCFVQFLGALYLETSYSVTRDFIYNYLLEQPAKSLESFILDKPLSTLIKRFALYKMESPELKTLIPKKQIPYFTTHITSGNNVNIISAYGITKDESINFALELLNKKTETISDTLALMFSKSFNTTK